MADEAGPRPERDTRKRFDRLRPAVHRRVAVFSRQALERFLKEYFRGDRDVYVRQRAQLLRLAGGFLARSAPQAFFPRLARRRGCYYITDRLD